MSPKSCIVVCFLWFSIVRSQTTRLPARFLTPLENPAYPSIRESLEDNPVYSVGKAFPNITWIPNPDAAMALTIWQASGSGSQMDIIGEEGVIQYLPGSVRLFDQHYLWNPIGVDGQNGNPTFDLSESNVFFFALYEAGSGDILSQTLSFNLTDSKIDAFGQPISTSSSSSSSIVSSTSTSVPSTSSTSPTTTSTSSIPAATTSAETSGSPGLSSGAKVGIGLGVGLGVAILIALLVGIFLLLKKKRKITPPSTPAHYTAVQTDYKPANASTLSSPQPYQASTFGGSRHELPSS